jgi:transposase-like protein
MSKKSFQERIPKEYRGLQLNFCRTPICENFGVSEEANEINLHEKDKNAKLTTQASRLYAISGVGKDDSTIKCKECFKLKSSDPERRQIYHYIKSNRAAYEQFCKISSYLLSPSFQCPNPDCISNTTDGVNKVKKAGHTGAGTQRYRCGHCKKSWTGDRAERVFGKPEVNKQFFKLLISKVAIRKIAFITDMAPATIYRRIDHLHRQCLRFIGERESRLLVKKYDRLYLCTDSQVQVSNWTDKKVKKNVEFYGIGTADLYSSYIFAFNFNYDADVDPNDIEQDAIDANDAQLKKYHRQHARLWLQHEFKENVENKNLMSLIPDAHNMSKDELRDALNDLRSASEDYDDESTQLPHKGMAIHNEYSIIAHFMLLKKLFTNVGKTRFYMDQDVGLRTWYLAVFNDLIKSSRSDAFHVSFDKGTTNDNKKKVFRDGVKKLEKVSGKSFNLMSHREKSDAATVLMLNDVRALQSPKSPRDLWVSNAMPSVPEPNKIIEPITDITGLNQDHQSRLIQKGGLHAIDRFFAQVRRSLMMFERPISSGANKNRTWYGYSPYNPALYQKLADIYRVHYNYCQVSKKDGKTPAMRLGLAKGPVAIEKIIYRGRYE